MRQAARGSPKGQQLQTIPSGADVRQTSAQRSPRSATTNNQNDNTPKFNMGNYSASAPGNARTQQFTATLVAVVGSASWRARTSGTPSARTFAQATACSSRGATSKPSAGKRVAPPSSTSFR